MYNIYEAKTNFSKLVGLVLDGEEVIVGKNNKPLIKMTPYEDQKKNKKKFKRTPGLLRGQMKMAPDFDTEDPAILKMFGIED